MRHEVNWICALVLIVQGAATERTSAAPVVLEEVARIVSPQPDREIRWITRWDSAQYSSRIALSGDNLILLGLSYDPDNSFVHYTPWIFGRISDGSWSHTATLMQPAEHTELYFGVPMDVAIQGDIAIARDIFRRSGGSWLRAADLALGPELDVSGTTLVDSSNARPGYGADVYQRQASNQWSLSQSISIQDVVKYSDGEYHGSDISLSGNQLIIHVPTGERPGTMDSVDNQAHVFERQAGQWSRVAELSAEGQDVAIDNGTAVVGATVFTRNAGGQWLLDESLERRESSPAAWLRPLAIANGLIVTGHPGDDARGNISGSMSVWERDTSGQFAEVARLLASDAHENTRLGYDIDIEGRRIVATAQGAAYVFEVPVTLPQRDLIEDDFEDGNAAGWTAVQAARFAVVGANGSRVYRQSDLTGDAGALFAAQSWDNIGIQADIRPTRFGTGGTNRWFGLVVRRSDANNYYYVTVRDTNVVQLKKKVNGVFSTLASAPLAVALNRTYRLRLEAIGTRLRVFNGDALLLDLSDSTHPQGHAGIAMYRTAADVDNVEISPLPQLRFYRNDFEREGDGEYLTHTGEGIWTWPVAPAGQGVYVQTNVDTPNGARALAGAATPDQIVQARAKATAFHASGNPWFGLIARYQDDANYYYLTVRKNNSIALRKLVNGVIHELDSAALTVAANQWYRLRLECVGNAVRVYVNDTLRLEAKDTSFSTGTYGLMTYRTAAQFDDVVVWQP